MGAQEHDRLRVLWLLQQKNKFDNYEDDKRVSNDLAIYTYEQAIIMFFASINPKLYPTELVDILKLTYEEVLEIAKTNDVLASTYAKLNLLNSMSLENYDIYASIY